MTIQLTFKEVLGYLEEKFHVKPTIETVDNKTIRISYKMGMFVPTINVNLRVDNVYEETIALSYDCSSIVNGLLSGTIGFIEQKIPKHQIEILPDAKRILVHLDAFKELEKVLALVEPTDIFFNNDAVVLDMALT